MVLSGALCCRQSTPRWLAVRAEEAMGEADTAKVISPRVVVATAEAVAQAAGSIGLDLHQLQRPAH